MKTLLTLVCVLALAWGCARVRVEAPKEAIKVDVSMRLDIYQHVEKDIDNIEDMVSAKNDKHSLLDLLVSKAHADEGGLGPDVQQAIERRKDRKGELSSLQAKGAVGENARGMVEAKTGEGSSVVQAENSDRSVIYSAIAAKNGTSVSDVERLYARRLQSDAPSGTPIETSSGWSTK